jgi:3'-5' exoribonuclease
MILSHHGKYEFGSPKLPMTPEALLLNTLDDLEAKMQTLRNAFASAAAQGRGAGEVTDWVRSMERPLFNSRAYLTEGATPEEDITAAAGERTVDEPVVREDAVEEPGVVTEPAGGSLFD